MLQAICRLHACYVVSYEPDFFLELCFWECTQIDSVGLSSIQCVLAYEMGHYSLLLLFSLVPIAGAQGELTISESNPGSVCTPWHFIITASLWEEGIISNPFLETRILGFWDLSHLPTCWSILVVNFELSSFSCVWKETVSGRWTGVLGGQCSSPSYSVYIGGLLPDCSGYQNFPDACLGPCRGAGSPTFRRREGRSTPQGPGLLMGGKYFMLNGSSKPFKTPMGPQVKY